MKKLMLLGLAIVFITSCNEKQRYTQQSPEIDTYKKVIAAYEKQNWNELATYYADTAKIQMNLTKEKAQTLPQNIAMNKEDAKLFTSWNFISKDAEYEMVVTDKGETWVNFWADWQGTLKSNNKTYTIPCSLTARFVDGKIVRELGYWNSTELVLDIQKNSPPPSTNDDVTEQKK